MAGTQFKIDVTIKDMSFPVLSFDPVLPAKGAMLLIDPAHPYRKMPSGPPVAGQLLPNLVADQASAIFGAGTSEADTQADWHQLPNGTPAVQPTVARTSRGGIYTAGKYATPKFPAKLIDYMITKPNNDFYVSIWGHADAESIDTVSELRKNGANAALVGEAFALKRSTSTPASTLLGASPPSSGVGKFRVSAAYTSHNLSGGDGNAFRSGLGTNPFGTFGNLGAEARRTYRFYMEDLTVSGRSYAVVDALDATEYAKQVLTSGGRYYGDSL